MLSTEQIENMYLKLVIKNPPTTLLAIPNNDERDNEAGYGLYISIVSTAKKITTKNTRFVISGRYKDEFLNEIKKFTFYWDFISFLKNITIAFHKNA